MYILEKLKSDQCISHNDVYIALHDLRGNKAFLNNHLYPTCTIVKKSATLLSVVKLSSMFEWCQCPYGFVRSAGYMT